MYATAREPAPAISLKPTQVGDVGYIHKGHSHLLSSVGCPSGERQLGVDVPLTCEPLSIGLIVYSQPRLPGCLSVNSVRETGADLRTSACPVSCVHSVPFVFFSTFESLSGEKNDRSKESYVFATQR